MTKQKNNLLDDLEDSLSEETPIPKQYKGKKTTKKLSESDIEVPKEDKEESVTIIDTELAKFEKNIKEIETILDSINPLAVADIEERAKVLKLKMDILYKLPPLYASLDTLRTKDKLKTEQIKGNKDISPLEDGSLD